MELTDPWTTLVQVMILSFFAAVSSLYIYLLLLTNPGSQG